MHTILHHHNVTAVPGFADPVSSFHLGSGTEKAKRCIVPGELTRDLGLCAGGAPKAAGCHLHRMQAGLRQAPAQPQ